MQSAETRYGAFRALWAMNENDPLVRGEKLGDQFTYHVLDVAGPPMVHVTDSYRPEVVLFGKDQHFELPLVLDAGQNILVNGQSGGKITVSRFTPGQEPRAADRLDQRRRSHPRDRRARRHVSRRRPGAAAGQARRRAREPLPGRRPARSPAANTTAKPPSTKSEDEHRRARRPIEQDSPLDVSTPLPDLFTQQR